MLLVIYTASRPMLLFAADSNRVSGCDVCVYSANASGVMAAVAAAREALLADMSPIDDIRATAHYRSVVTQNVLGHMLRELATA